MTNCQASCSYFPQHFPELIDTKSVGETNEIIRVLKLWPYAIGLHSNNTI